MRDDGDPISGIPSLGPYTELEIEMSPYTATRQLMLLCVLIGAYDANDLSLKLEGISSGAYGHGSCLVPVSWEEWSPVGWREWM